MLAGGSLPVAAHNWHAEFTTVSGSGGSVTSPYSSSTGAAGGDFTVTYNQSLPSTWLTGSGGAAVFSVGSTSCRGRFAVTHTMAGATGYSVGFRLRMDSSTITRGPIQLCVYDGATMYTCYVRYNNSTITILQNGGTAYTDPAPYNLSGSSSVYKNWCVAVKVGGGEAHWNVWVDGVRLAFSGSNGNHTYDGVTYSFKTPPNDFTAVNGLAYIGLGELYASSGWAFRFDWVRWTDQGAIYFGDPYVHSNPANQSKNVGETATFSVAAWSDATISYQWQSRPSGGSWSDISGATSSSYVTPTLVAGDHGKQYRCRLNRSGYPNVFSEVATLSISCVPPSITSQPASLVRCAGQMASFSVAASGTSPSYQWRKNGSNISGATSSTYTIPSVGVGDAANYNCVVTNACGSVTSNTASLTVNVPPSITLQPADTTVTEGDNVTLTVAAEGTSPISYQWRKNEIDIVGAVSAAYTINNAEVEDSGSYDCVVSNMCGSITSEVAVLRIVPPLHPLGLSNRNLGGGDWFYDPNTGAGQRGISDSEGLNNIGALVRMWGAFSYIDAGAFTIDDGSGIIVRCEVPASVVLDPAWEYVIVTGISSCYKENDDLWRLLLVRQQEDIQAIVP
jgi:hypothetical protein